MFLYICIICVYIYVQKYRCMFCYVLFLVAWGPYDARGLRLLQRMAAQRLRRCLAQRSLPQRAQESLGLGIAQSRSYVYTLGPYSYAIGPRVSRYYVHAWSPGSFYPEPKQGPNKLRITRELKCIGLYEE